MVAQAAATPATATVNSSIWVPPLCTVTMVVAAAPGATVRSLSDSRIEAADFCVYSPTGTAALPVAIPVRTSVPQPRYSPQPGRVQNCAPAGLRCPHLRHTIAIWRPGCAAGRPAPPGRTGPAGAALPGGAVADSGGDTAPGVRG